MTASPTHSESSNDTHTKVKRTTPSGTEEIFSKFYHPRPTPLNGQYKVFFRELHAS